MTDGGQSSAGSGFSSAHELLEALCGEWQCEAARTWFEPDVLGDESAWRGSISMSPCGRFAVHNYRGKLCGEDLIGQAIIGYSRGRDRYEIAWIDSCHNGSTIMYSTGGEFEPGSRSFSVLGTYPDGQKGPEWGWRSEWEIIGPDSIACRHYNIDLEGKEALAVEAIYKRV